MRQAMATSGAVARRAFNACSKSVAAGQGEGIGHAHPPWRWLSLAQARAEEGDEQGGVVHMSKRKGKEARAQQDELVESHPIGTDPKCTR